MQAIVSTVAKMRFMIEFLTLICFAHGSDLVAGAGNESAINEMCADTGETLARGGKRNASAAILDKRKMTGGETARGSRPDPLDGGRPHWRQDHAIMARGRPAGGLSSGPRVGGGAERDRTADLLIANEALSQLSYGPKSMRNGSGLVARVYRAAI